MKYLIVVEKTETGFSAYSPDLLGCVATGATEEETEANIEGSDRISRRGTEAGGIPRTAAICEVCLYRSRSIRALRQKDLP